MDKLFNPQSIAILGLSSKPANIPRLILENLIRWGFKGQIFGINPSAQEDHVHGIRLFKEIDELPLVPDLVVALIPAKYIPATIEACGKFGVKRMAIPSAGFNESGEAGEEIAALALKYTHQYGLRFVGPNGLTIANTANGLCLPFVPAYKLLRGEVSIITQSGGIGLSLWNRMIDEQIGMAKFASIGNKLDLDEVDFLEYFGRDSETRVIGIYLEGIPRGEKLLGAASKIDKPIIVLKANTTLAGRKAAMSHTAALQNNEAVIDAAFERAGILRVETFVEMIAVFKAFKLPPMRGKRIMAISPGGGISVMMADLCEKVGFELADPGETFYREISQYANAGVIAFSNPLDLGDVYDPQMYAHILHAALHNPNVDGAVFASMWAHMPKGEDVFNRIFHTDLAQVAPKVQLSSGKPLGVNLAGLAREIAKVKKRVNFPIFNNIEEMINALNLQRLYYARQDAGVFEISQPLGIDIASVREWIREHRGTFGEEALELLSAFGIPVFESAVAKDVTEAVELAGRIGYPVVMKVISPDAVHKSEAGGVILGIKDEREVRQAFGTIRANLNHYKVGADLRGVQVMQMAGEGVDMFIGATRDASYGPVVYFGYGGIYVEVFNDTAIALCPSNRQEIEAKLKGLKSYKILQGLRGKALSDIGSYLDLIERISHLASVFPQIQELDLNPVRVFEQGHGAFVLDARIRVDK
ncbi:MAG: acetate--CoA ligase family protein [Anaerolineales bacterium]|nr:acetate--CoA ligase family protein [Anaerolineales bacterium]